MAQQTRDCVNELSDTIKASWHRFLDVYEPLRPELYRYCRYLTRSPWDAEDLAQDTLARAFVTLGCLFKAVPPNPKAWLLRVASNLWIDRTRRTRETVGDIPELAAEPEAGVDPETDAEFESEMMELLRNVDGMIFGRVSYQLLAQYWSTAGMSSAAQAPGGFTSRQREIEFARLMNSIPKIVYSRTLQQQPEWGPVTVGREVNAQDIARLKRQTGKDLVLFAGGSLASAFAKLDLFDEYRLMIHPVIVGNGIALFQGLKQQLKLKPQQARTFPSGVTLLQYERGS